MRMFHHRSRYSTATVRPLSVRPGNRRLPLAFRAWATLHDDATQALYSRNPLLARLEAILLLADEPLTLRRLSELSGCKDSAEANQLIQQLKELLDADETAFQIEEIAGGYQLLTRPRYHPWLSRLKRTGHELRLTPAIMETLAVIAYRQPIMRAEVEKVRGVACGELVRQLMEKGLIRVAGRHDSLGRPQLYGTTKKFLQAFGLHSLQDLPEVEALQNPKR